MVPVGCNKPLTSLASLSPQINKKTGPVKHGRGHVRITYWDAG